MAVGSVSPVAVQQFFDANGDPLAGGKLFFYLAGTTTPTPAYADVGLTVPLANPVILDAAGRAPELFLGAVTYKQVLQNAGGVTIWTADDIVTPTALRSTQAGISLTGTQHNVPIPAGVITFINCTNASPLTITGFANGTPGQILVVRSGSAAPVYLVHADLVNSPGNILYNFVGSGPTPLSGNHGMALYVNALGSWMLVAHEQGTWLPIPFNAANFTGDVGAWTVESGDIGLLDYKLSGTSLLLSISLSSTSVSGGPTFLRIANLPYQIRAAVVGLTATVVDNGVAQNGFFDWYSGNTVQISHGSPWAASTNLTAVFSQHSYDVS